MKKTRLTSSGMRLSSLICILMLGLCPLQAQPKANTAKKESTSGNATPAEQLTVPSGFTVKLLHSATTNEGSWICMTTDNKGRLIISPQKDAQPLLRVTLNRTGGVVKIEPIPAPVKQAMGLCYAHNSLYENGHGPEGTGLYRLSD